ncbi:MAG: GNAT family N-acetyltransferase, partial [Gammaproteobacteria bacterium]
MKKAVINAATIRDLAPADGDCVAGFVTELNRLEAGIVSDRDPSEQAGKDHFEYLRREMSSRGGFCLVAEHEKKLLGFLLAAPESMPGFIVKPEYRSYGEIYDIYVVPEVRGMGLGRKLIDDALDRFRDMGLRQAGLYSVAGNT